MRCTFIFLQLCRDAVILHVFLLWSERAHEPLCTSRSWCGGRRNSQTYPCTKIITDLATIKVTGSRLAWRSRYLNLRMNSWTSLVKGESVIRGSSMWLQRRFAAFVSSTGFLLANTSTGIWKQIKHRQWSFTENGRLYVQWTHQFYSLQTSAAVLLLLSSAILRIKNIKNLIYLIYKYLETFTFQTGCNRSFKFNRNGHEHRTSQCAGSAFLGSPWNRAGGKAPVTPGHWEETLVKRLHSNIPWGYLFRNVNVLTIYGPCSSDRRSSGFCYRAFDQAQHKLLGAAAICCNNTDRCSRNLSEEFCLFFCFCFGLTCALKRLMHCFKFRGFVAASRALHIFIFRFALCHDLNQHNTASGCKGASLYTRDIHYCHVLLISP